jgi:hypothetical protein
MLSRKIIALVGCFLVIGIAACTNSTTNTPATSGKERDLIFDSVKGLTGAGNAFIDSADADTLRHDFDVFHRNKIFYTGASGYPKPTGNNDVPVGTNRCNDSLSRSVWFDKRVIKYLNDVLQGNGPIDGVRIYFASYNKMGCAPGQYTPRQATIFIVPTDLVPGTNKHKDDYSYIEKFVKNGGLNHGELCPSECN